MTEAAGDYLVMRHAEIRIGAFRASAVQPEHIEKIRRWRNAQLRGLRQARPITPKEQARYFETRIWPDKLSREPANMLLIYRHEDTIIGYGGLVHIAWPDRRAEVSFLLDPDYSRTDINFQPAFGKWLELMQLLAFEHLQLSRLTTETYETRSENIAVLDRAGFEREGLLKGHVLIDGAPVDAILHGLNRNRMSGGT